MVLLQRSRRLKCKTSITSAWERILIYPVQENEHSAVLFSATILKICPFLVGQSAYGACANIAPFTTYANLCILYLGQP